MKTRTLAAGIVLSVLIPVGFVTVFAQRIQYTPPPVSAGSPASQAITMVAQTTGSQASLGAGGAELISGRFKVIADVENSTQTALFVRFISACTGTPGTLVLDYSLDGNTWTTISGSAISCLASTTIVAPFVSLPTAARARDVWFRTFFTDGTLGTPSVSVVEVRFR